MGLDELAARNDLSIVESEGLGSWKRIEASAWAFDKALKGQFKIGVVFDRDYFSDSEIYDISNKLERYFSPVHMHERKEIENYLLEPVPLEGAIRRALRDRNRRTGKNTKYEFDVTKELEAITDATREHVTSQLVAKRLDYKKAKGVNASTITNEVLEMVGSKWNSLETRIALVPGDEVLGKFRKRVQEEYSVNISDIKIIDEFRTDEIPTDLAKLLLDLNDFRKS